MRGLGIDVGAGSVCIALAADGKLSYHDYALHKGKPEEVLRERLRRMEEACPGAVDYAAVNRAGAYLYPRAPKEALADRVTALAAGRALLYPEAGSVMEMGAQTSCYVTGFGRGEALEYAVNGECAAGTGAFFEDLAYRLGIPLEAYSETVRQAKSVPRLAGRCSVFAKTDLIHRQQEGCPAADILLGLAFAVVQNYKAAVVRRLPVRKPVVLAGGTAKNEGVLRAVRESFRLEEGELLGTDLGPVLPAAGLAALALERGCAWDWKNPCGERSGGIRESLPLTPFSYEKDRLHATRPLRDGERPWLGVDVGSTSTNLVLLGEDGAVVDYQYLRTQGDPLGAVSRGAESWKDKYGEEFRPAGIGVTGSGRHLAARHLQAETVVDEITAQARAAVFFNPGVDTVFEIGGQDSKYISLRNGQVADFEMNKVCAAGTGSFIEEQANRLGLEVGKIGPSALAAREPAKLGERCTVLMESRIASELAEGTGQEDICAGLCRSIVGNYLNRVVKNKPVGQRISLQGGIVHNEGIVAAFGERFGDRLAIAPYYDVTGAVGAAIEARMAAEAGKEEPVRNQGVSPQPQGNKWFLAGYDETLEPGKKTIGIPRSLMIYKFFPMAYQYFKGLGFHVLLSKETDEEIIALSQEFSQEETCYPVKLMLGHMELLARNGVDYIFIPRVRTIRHERSNVEHNYGCVYMQTAPVLAAETLELEKRGIRLLSPILDLDMGKPQMAGAMIQAGVSLGKDKLSCAAALAKGAAAMVQCEKQAEKAGRELMASLKPEEKVLVLITRNYGLSDPVLNMGIPGELRKRGCRVLTLANLPGHSIDLSQEYPNLYWPFGQHILSGAKIIRDTPNLYAVYLTNHGCGPDTMLAHLFGEMMGDKPYLAIEVDEHQSAVGVVTRIEAFLNSLKYTENRTWEKSPRPRTAAVEELGELPEGTLYLPPLGVHGRLAAKLLGSMGIRAEALADVSLKELRAGKEAAISKESCTFCAAAGQAFSLAAGGEAASYFLPQTQGAEAEGEAARVIQALLEKKGLSGLTLFSPMLERFGEWREADQLWQVLVLGDAIGRLELERREALEASGFREITFPLTVPETRRLLREWQRDKERGREVFLFGEPMLLNSPLLNRDLEEAVRARGFVPAPMFLSEYLWYWLKEAGKEIPEDMTRLIEELRQLYGDQEEPLEAEFGRIAERFPRVTGGNIRYLADRTAQSGKDRAGNLLLTPAYLNSASIVNLVRQEGRVPFFHFQVDGNQEADEIEKRDIFLELLAESGR